MVPLHPEPFRMTECDFLVSGTKGKNQLPGLEKSAGSWSWGPPQVEVRLSRDLKAQAEFDQFEKLGTTVAAPPPESRDYCGGSELFKLAEFCLRH